MYLREGVRSGPNVVFIACKPFKRMAGSTGLEPAASAVTGQRSNQLNYDPAFGYIGLAETRAAVVIGSPCRRLA